MGGRVSCARAWKESDAVNAVEKAVAGSDHYTYIHTLIHTYTHTYIHSYIHTAWRNTLGQATSVPMHASNPAINSNNPPPSVSARPTSDGLSKAAGFLSKVVNCYDIAGSGVKVPAASALCTFAPAASGASLKPRVSVQADECAAGAKTSSFAFKSALGGAGLPALKKTVTRVTRADGSVSRSAGHASARKPCNVN